MRVPDSFPIPDSFLSPVSSVSPFGSPGWFPSMHEQKMSLPGTGVFVRWNMQINPNASERPQISAGLEMVKLDSLDKLCGRREPGGQQGHLRSPLTQV